MSVNYFSRINDIFMVARLFGEEGVVLLGNHTEFKARAGEISGHHTLFMSAPTTYRTGWFNYALLRSEFYWYPITKIFIDNEKNVIEKIGSLYEVSDGEVRVIDGKMEVAMQVQNDFLDWLEFSIGE